MDGTRHPSGLSRATNWVVVTACSADFSAVCGDFFPSNYFISRIKGKTNTTTVPAIPNARRANIRNRLRTLQKNIHTPLQSGASYAPKSGQNSSQRKTYNKTFWTRLRK